MPADRYGGFLLYAGNDLVEDPLLRIEPIDHGIRIYFAATSRGVLVE